MSAIPVIAVFDVGKTNKKLFLFDEDYRIVFEMSVRLEETVDEDGYPCEDLAHLRRWVFDALNEVCGKKEFVIKAVNFSAYGASFVYIDNAGNEAAPLYNYLKPYPEKLAARFYRSFGGEEQVSLSTASPALGSLNSGLQLYRLKHEQPEIYRQVKYALHLPQYLSHLLTGIPCSDITSIGCHTAIWDFTANNYHEWIRREGIAAKLAAIKGGEKTVKPARPGAGYQVGAGLHDSSAALIPYLLSFKEPFILISTGTWCISLNPFNRSSLTVEQLKKDCLCYLQYAGEPVKASRLFSGFEHEQQVKRIAAHFMQDEAAFANMPYSASMADRLQNEDASTSSAGELEKTSAFGERELSQFNSGTEAYHQLMIDLVAQQVASTTLVLEGTNVKRLFVDGGFSSNSIFMHLLAKAFPSLEVFAASMPQASAIGAALVIHKAWNSKSIPQGIIALRRYGAG